MYEIEAKVRLSSEDFKRLKKKIPEFARKKGEVLNKDSYYYNSRPFLLRIREKNGKGILTIKSKNRGKGIELNNEIELPLRTVGGFHAFLKKAGIPVCAEKEKKSLIFTSGKMRIELNEVGRLGYFLEIETLVKSGSQIPKAKKALLKLFGELGFKPENFEKKYYLELLYPDLITD